MEVRSYRTVFELERRIYRIDRFRLNPSGVPLRGVAYFVLAGVTLAALHGLPVVRWVVDPLPWYVRYLALPLGLSALLSAVRIDGRAFHVAISALWNGSWRNPRTSGLQPRRRGSSRWIPPPLILIPDGADPWPRPFRFRGPGAVMIRTPHRLRPARRRARLPGTGARVRIVWSRPGDSRCGPGEDRVTPGDHRVTPGEDRVISLHRGTTAVVEGRRRR